MFQVKTASMSNEGLYDNIIIYFEQLEEGESFPTAIFRIKNSLKVFEGTKHEHLIKDFRAFLPKNDAAAEHALTVNPINVRLSCSAVIYTRQVCYVEHALTVDPLAVRLSCSAVIYTRQVCSSPSGFKLRGKKS